MGNAPAASSDKPEARKARHPLLAATLSAVLPGLGQVYAGRKKRGASLLLGTALVSAAVTVPLIRDPRSLLKLAFDRKVLIALLFANAAVFLFRVFAAVDAYRSAGLAPTSRLSGWVAVPIIGLILVAPHGWFAYYDAVQYDLIDSVFTATTTTTAAAPEPTTTEAAVSSPTSTPPVTSPPQTTEPPAVWGDLERLNILVLGSDSGVGRTGVRTDTMILVSVDVNTGDLAMFSIPRNFANVPLPESIGLFSCDCFPPILNELYQYGEDHPGSFAGPATPGANAIKGAISELTGLPVHYYAMVALDGFVEIVDAIGGVTITVTERVFDPAYPSEDGGTEKVDWLPGTYEMDGHEALTYARTRHSDDDYHRMGRQRCVVEAVLEQADPFSLLRNYPSLAEVIKTSVETDIPLEAVPQLIDLLSVVDTDTVLSIRFVPPTYISGWTADLYGVPDVDLIREHAAIATTLPPASAIELLGIEPGRDACE